MFTLLGSVDEIGWLGGVLWHTNNPCALLNIKSYLAFVKYIWSVNDKFVGNTWY